jgi:plastocyanin
MSRISLFIAGLVAMLALAAPSAGMSPTKLVGTTGPGFTITLKKAGVKVRTLKPGKYLITVNDKSNLHDFHLKGTGVNRVITATQFKGTKSVTVTLKKGRYTYLCDPHAATMTKHFTVT